MHPAMAALVRPSYANDHERQQPLILEDDDNATPPKKKVTAEGRLIIATLQFATRDFWCLPSTTPEWHSARRWLFEDIGVPPFTLEIACEILETNVEYIRELALKQRAVGPGMRSYSTTIAI
jgi:hypothetical protein